MRYDANAIYELLPAVYRLRDAEQGEVLRAFISVLAEQAEIVEEDIARLYDNWFVETCDEWVVPYLGDLLAARPLYPVSKTIFSRRAWVANTLGYRRRKGTVAVLEQLARDVTGWPAKAVEFFQLLSTTQYLNHFRPASCGTPDLRNADALEQIDGPFDMATHTADVRHIASGRGKYNIPHVGLFLWRLQSYPLAGVTAFRLDSRRFSFSPLGLDTPLFNQPLPEAQLAQLAKRVNVEMPISRRALHADLPGYYGDEQSLAVTVDGVMVPTTDVVVCNLSDKSATGWAHEPASGKVALDPELGRIALAADADEVRVSYHYGFSGDVGSGPYARNAALAQTLAHPVRWGISWVADVQRGATPEPATRLFDSVTAAITAWNALPAGTEGAIVVLDSQSYDLSSVPAITVDEGSRLLFVAGTWPDDVMPGTAGHETRAIDQLRAEDVRPHLHGDLTIRGTAATTSTNPGEVALNGLLIDGKLVLQAGHLGRLRISHSTLVPPQNSITVAAGTSSLRMQIERSIAGPIALVASDSPGKELIIIDSIIHAPPIAGRFGAAISAPDAAADIRDSTILGSTAAYSVQAENTIFVERLSSERRQIGCVRFSYVPAGSRTPRRYRCQPDLALASYATLLGLKSADDLSASHRDLVRARLAPAFTSHRYGHPAYAQLSRACAVEICTGAEDGAEMGVFSHLKAPQREANLRASLDEYLTFGLQAGVFYVT